MSLIDRTYFVGDINIPFNTQNTGAIENINLFIEKREPEFLKKTLGFKMYKALMDGLLEDPIDQKWIDLLQGTEYEDNDQEPNEWKGLVGVPVSSLNILNALGSYEIKVGGGGMYDPVDGSSTTIIPPAFVGKPFIFEMRGIGQLGPDEYSVSGNVLTLLGSASMGDPIFNAGSYSNRFYYRAVSISAASAAGTYKQSPIANYVYYHFTANQATRTTTVGESKTKTVNSIRTSPIVKQARAWNEMVERVWEMYHFLEVRKEDYPDLLRQHDYDWQYINTFNL